MQHLYTLRIYRQQKASKITPQQNSFPVGGTIISLWAMKYKGIIQTISILVLGVWPRNLNYQYGILLKAIQVIISCTRKLDVLPVCGYSDSLMGLPRCSLKLEDTINLSCCEAYHLWGIHASCKIYSSIQNLSTLSEECLTFLSFPSFQLAAGAKGILSLRAFCLKNICSFFCKTKKSVCTFQCTLKNSKFNYKQVWCKIPKVIFVL